MGRGRVGVVRALVALVLLTVVVGVGGVRAEAAWEPALEWEATGLTGRVTELFTPSSGAFFAVQQRLGAREIAPGGGDRADEGLWRSDDAGVTWRRIGLPPRADRVWVDPTDHSIIYTHAHPRLHKSTDGGESWTQLVLTLFPETDSEVYVGILAISPADPQLLQAQAWNGSMRHLLRSRDGGLSWASTVQELGPPTCCPPRTLLIQPHPTDAARVLRVAGEYVASTFVADVEVSDDQATTWQRRGRPEIEGLATGRGGEGAVDHGPRLRSALPGLRVRGAGDRGAAERRRGADVAPARATGSAADLGARVWDRRPVAVRRDRGRPVPDQPARVSRAG